VKVRQLDPATWVLVFDKGEEPVSALETYLRDQGVTAASFTAIGALSEAVVGYFDRERREYEEISVDEQVELLALTGDVAVADGQPKVHAHAVLGRRDGSVVGGHLLRARVWPTLELVLHRSPVELRKRHDPETGLALIDPSL
jgi:uncharacterized protein